MKYFLILMFVACSAIYAEEHKVIELKPVMYQMKFNPAVLTAKAGQSVELRFDNIDVQPHNVLICAPGSKEAIGRLADRLAVSPGRAGKDYIPQCKQVLHAMKVVPPGKKGTLRFFAPTEPGDYVFICTCPGQWRLMNGVFKVTPAD